MSNNEHLTLEQQLKIIYTYEKVLNFRIISGLFNISEAIIRTIFNNRDNIVQQYNCPNAIKIKAYGIIPRMVFRLNQENETMISIIELKYMVLLGKCICEALKRQQNFSVYTIKRTTEIFKRIFKSKRFTIPEDLFSIVTYDYVLRFPTPEEEEEIETQPAKVNMSEIIEFCLKELENNIIEFQSKIFSLSNKPKEIKITSYNDVLNILKPIEDFAALNNNQKSLKCIHMLEKHIHEMNMRSNLIDRQTLK